MPAMQISVSTLRLPPQSLSVSARASVYALARPSCLKSALCLACLALLLGLPASAQSHRAAQAGDRAYSRRDYREAEQQYRAAQPGAPAAYNAGNSAYQQGKYADAVTCYQQAAVAGSTAELRADALYNLGNAFLKQQKWAEAIVSYEKSLRQQPNRADAKKNLQIARRKQQEQDPPPPPPPSKLPPPPPPQARQQQMDRAQPYPRRPATPPLSADAARQLLNTAVTQEEQRSAKRYRELSGAEKASKGKKNW